MTENSSQAKTIRPGISDFVLLTIAGVVRHPDGSLEIPYYDLAGNPIGYSRTRLPHVRSNGQKYDQPKGSGVHVCLPPQLAELLDTNTGAIIPPGSCILVEGEFKAYALVCERIPAIGLPGLYACKAVRDENGDTIAREVLDDLLAVIQAKQIKIIYFLGDADTCHNFLFSFEAWTLAVAARKFGVEVYLPRLDAAGPKGIDDIRETFIGSGISFKVFVAKLIEEAILLDPDKMGPQALALLLLKDQEQGFAILAKTQEWPRIRTRLSKMCAWAQLCRHKDAENTQRLIASAGKISGLSIKDFASDIKAQREYLRREWKRERPERDEPEEQRTEDDTSRDGPREDAEPKVYIEFLSPSQIKAYQPPPGTLLVGDNHIVRGTVFVIGGPPGIGKSRSTIALAEGGATKLDWLGQKVHVNFKTIIIQNENGRYRLKLEFAQLDEKVLDQYLKISPPPPFGLCFNKREFRDQLKKQIDLFQPGVIIIDPWNAVARDDKARDYGEAFDLVREVIPAGDAAPSIGVCAHTRKPLANERASGRALLNLLAGSYVLISVPRTVWVLQHASDDVAENRVVVTCCKNNDGELGPRSVWIRDNGLWTPYQGFDWDEWDNPDPDKKIKVISERTLQEVFENGNRAFKLSEATVALMKLTGKKKSVCYAALNEKGPFKDSLNFDPKTRLITWICGS